MSDNVNAIKKLPNKAFDSEYATQFRKEMIFLKQHGINYTYMYKTKEYGVPTYKYTKTSRLFQLVAAFYKQQQNQKNFNQAKEMFNKGVYVDPGALGDISISLSIDPRFSVVKKVTYNTPNIDDVPEQQKVIQE